MGKSNALHPIRNFATDYENYDIYYACDDSTGYTKVEEIAIMSRNYDLTEEKWREVRSIVKKRLPHINLDGSNM